MSETMSGEQGGTRTGPTTLGGVPYRAAEPLVPQFVADDAANHAYKGGRLAYRREVAPWVFLAGCATGAVFVAFGPVVIDWVRSVM